MFLSRKHVLNAFIANYDKRLSLLQLYPINCKYSLKKEICSLSQKKNF